MKAIRCKVYGPPSSLVLEELESLKPGPKEVVVGVKACGINFPDTLIIQGLYQFKPDLPFTPGSDIAGVVKEVGEEVTHLKKGDEVFGFVPYGALAEEVIVPSNSCFPKPKKMDYPVAASFMMAYGTSHHALKDRAKLKKGETLLVLGADVIYDPVGGDYSDRTLEKMSEDEWDAVIEVNLKGVFLCTQAVVPYMKANKYGRIVSAASNVGLRGNFGQTNYAATKAGVIAMAKTWTVEFGKHGITANAIAPGFTMTDMVSQIPEEHFDAIKASIPLKTVAQPIDFAYGYLYLASDEARFISGICLTIDGGTSR